MLYARLNAANMQYSYVPKFSLDAFGWKLVQWHKEVMGESTSTDNGGRKLLDIIWKANVPR